MEILEQREQWQARFHAGWLAHYQQTGEIDWGRYNRPGNEHGISGSGIDPSMSRLMFISSAGAYLRDRQAPFDAEHPLGDYSIRAFPSFTSLDDLAFAHTHYDHAAVERDPQVLIPLRHLKKMVTEGAIGELSPSMVSFMGYHPDLGRVIDETIPSILDVAQDEGVRAALLVPA